MNKLYTILGCTACGKAATGRELARRLNGSILSVDSMKIYRRMDIGTAKPSRDIIREIPHYGIDIVEPAEHFSVSAYWEYAMDALDEIGQTGRIPLAVGGTSLYLKAMYEGLFQGPARNDEFRSQMDNRILNEGLEVLHAELMAVDPEAGSRIHVNDRKRIIRALEVYHLSGTTISSLQTQWGQADHRQDMVRIGLRRQKEQLNHRINMRVKRMVENGLFQEVESLLREPAKLSKEAAQAVGYAEVIEHLNGRLGFDEAVERIKINTRHLAKKQRTWQRRWTDVIWFDIEEDQTPEQIADMVMERVNFTTGEIDAPS